MLHPRARTMLLLAIPALIIGVASSLVLIVVMKSRRCCRRCYGRRFLHNWRQRGFAGMDHVDADAHRRCGGSGDPL